MSGVGLPVSRVINVTVNLQPVAAQAPNLSSLVVAGDSNVIDTFERMRSYSSLASIATDFGTTAPEYLAAVPFFGQNPAPQQLYIAKWAKAATAGTLRGGILSTAQQAIGLWNAVVAGNFKLAVDGGAVTNVVCGSFAAAANLNAVAAIIQTAVRALAGAFAAVTVVWTGTQFVITSGTTGATSAISALTAGTANDISVMLRGAAGTLQRIVNGIVAETPLACATILAALSTQWYGLTFAAAAFAGTNATTPLADADNLAVAAFIEGSGLHIYGFTTSDGNALVIPDTITIGAQMHALLYKRTSYQYSSSNPYAWNALIGRELVVNYNGNNTVIDIVFKQEPGVIAETLTTNQANALDANNYNYFVNFNNNTAIIQGGQMAGEYYIDEVLGTDWLASTIQNNLYNLLYTADTKIPQTDSGNHILATGIEAACVQGVTNGLIAPGVWNAGGFGQLSQGDFLPKGFYVYTPPINSQLQANRSARQSVVFQTAAKMAGSIRTVNCLISVNQ